jgi:hypothetical protein
MLLLLLQQLLLPAQALPLAPAGPSEACRCCRSRCRVLPLLLGLLLLLLLLWLALLLLLW